MWRSWREGCYPVQVIQDRLCVSWVAYSWLLALGGSHRAKGVHLNRWHDVNNHNFWEFNKWVAGILSFGFLKWDCAPKPQCTSCICSVSGSAITPRVVSFEPGLKCAVLQVYVLKRPHVDEFLQKMGELFECVLFTASLAKVCSHVGMFSVLTCVLVISHH